MEPETSRREFLTATVAVGAAALAANPSPTPAQPAESSSGHGKSSPQLQIKPRYHRWHVDPGVEWVETNTRPATLDWSIPLSQAALILVDVWDRHYLLDTQARAEKAINDKLVPLLGACRKAGLPIIHAPSPSQAKSHPNWVGHTRDASASGEPAPAPKGDDWPPREFRAKSGPFRAYGRPDEPRAAELARLRAGLTIHPKVRPAGDEPVIATGEVLHRLCKQRGILFLLFAGFNTNACILVRDYGTLAMSERGYEVILIRDCTTGMESADSHPTLAQTQGAILLLEMFGQYSITSNEIRAGLPPAV